MSRDGLAHNLGLVYTRTAIHNVQDVKQHSKPRFRRTVHNSGEARVKKKWPAILTLKGTSREVHSGGHIQSLYLPRLTLQKAVPQHRLGLLQGLHLSRKD